MDPWFSRHLLAGQKGWFSWSCLSGYEKNSVKRSKPLSDSLTGNLANHDMTQKASTRHCSGLLVRLWKTNGHCEMELFENLITPANLHCHLLKEVVLRCSAILEVSCRNHKCSCKTWMVQTVVRLLKSVESHDDDTYFKYKLFCFFAKSLCLHAL